tara:strand:+ start:148 stop:414 length:267 start_codon:yes stop_codon:yes gene_type:complete
MVNLIKKWWVQLHLRYICPHCPYEKKHTRDIKHTGKCWWQEEWKKGHYKNVPMWMGFRNYFRLYLLKKTIRICLDGKVYEGYKWKEKN